jgi:GT2 family glycosyltransferase
MTDSIETSIIIVSWNVQELLRACLNSLELTQYEGQKIEVIVVDGGSKDGSVEMIRQDFPLVKLVAREDNVGFPKGNNLGMAQAKGDYFLLLNPDTEVIDDAPGTMVSFLKNNPQVGAVGPRLLNPDGTIQSSRRRFPTFATAVFESTWLESRAPRSLLDQYYMNDLPEDESVEVDWLVGACLMVRREVYTSVGPMDEDYFMYSEELDWCRRIKENGWKIVNLPDAKVIHHYGKSSDQAIVQRHINFQQAKLRYFRKFHGRETAIFLRSVLLTNYAWQILVELLKGIVGHKRELRKQRMRAYWQVLRSGLRPAGY